MIPVKIICRCGQKYAFDVQPVNGRMPVPIFCPACGLEGTVEANQFIARILHGKTQPLPPPSVATVLTSVQSTLAPHLVEALKDAIVQELAGQRRELLAAQQAAAAERQRSPMAGTGRNGLFERDLVRQAVCAGAAQFEAQF